MNLEDEDATIARLTAQRNEAAMLLQLHMNRAEEAEAKLAEVTAERDEWKDEYKTAEKGLNVYRKANVKVIAERDAARAKGFAQGIEAAANARGMWFGFNSYGEPTGEYCTVKSHDPGDMKLYISHDAIRALSPTPPVDVNETPVHYQQAGLSLTDDTQTPQADLETCPNCEGTGIAGHPDSGYTCTKCSGCGGVQPEADPVRDAAENLLKTIWFDGPGATDIINMDAVNALRAALAPKGDENDPPST